MDGVASYPLPCHNFQSKLLLDSILGQIFKLFWGDTPKLPIAGAYQVCINMQAKLTFCQSFHFIFCCYGNVLYKDPSWNSSQPPSWFISGPVPTKQTCIMNYLLQSGTFGPSAHYKIYHILKDYRISSYPITVVM